MFTSSGRKGVGALKGRAESSDDGVIDNGRETVRVSVRCGGPRRKDKLHLVIAGYLSGILEIVLCMYETRSLCNHSDLFPISQSARSAEETKSNKGVQRRFSRVLIWKCYQRPVWQSRSRPISARITKCT